jgi:hypothetical protein
MDLQHPATGQHTRASDSTAKQLIKDGWKPINADEKPASSAAPKAESTKEPASDDGKNAAPSTADEKPLDKLKLTELIAHAEKIGVPTEDLEPLRKPGASKKQAIEIIEAHTA